MPIRIHVQAIYPPTMPGFGGNGLDGYARINAGVMRVFRKVLRPDTEVTIGYVPRSTYMTSHSHLELLNNIEILRGVIQAEKAGYDVAFIRCGNDPAVRESREAVSIPVVGMTEAAMHFACQLGSRFAIIGVDAKSGPMVERNLRQYGLENRAISRRPVRYPEGDAFQEVVRQGPQWFDSPDYVRDNVVPEFERVAHACIEDGAEVIVTGCALYSSLTLAGYNRIGGTNVPVVESMAIAVKTAEMLGELHRSLGISTSKHLTYQNQLTPQVRDSLMAPYFPGE
jgi:allantoin racemase